jgi:hypothetical protein
MATQTVIWTTLPRDITSDGKKLRLSAFVSPRLQIDANESHTLGHFPDFLHWPDVVRKLHFVVQVVNGGSIPASVVESRLEPSLWKLLFNKNTFVRSYTFQDYSKHEIQSYSVRNVTNTLRQNYKLLGVVSPGSTPLLQDVIEQRDRPSPNQNPVLQAFGRQVIASVATLAIPWNGDPATYDRALSYQENIGKYGKLKQQQYDPHFVKFLKFHHMPVTHKLRLPKTPQDAARLMDFHQAISSLSSYPELLRRLGLVIDLEIPADSIPLDTPGAQRFIEVIPQPARPDFVSPMTAFTHSKSAFTAPSQSREVERGMLNLSSDLYDLVQVDVDGAAFKNINFAVNFLNVFDPNVRDSDFEKDIGLPSVRSAGISVTRNDRASTLQNSIASSKQFNQDLGQVVQSRQVSPTVTPPPSPPQFFMEALVAGYRVDIWDSRTRRWHSLCERVGDYRFLNSKKGTTEAELSNIHDEGFVQMGVSQPVTNGAQPPSLHLHESLFRWDGWSLVAPHPGKSISADRNPAAPPTTPANDPVTPFKLRTTFTPEPHSLPTLRFGVNYQLRVRVVDLAGNSITLAEANALAHMPDLPTSSKAFEYLRYDPVIAPAVILRHLIVTKNDPGETLERLIIRSVNSDPSLDKVPTKQTSERHIAPPKISQAMAEMHGKFDTASGAPDTALYHTIAKKDAGTFSTQPFVDGANTIPVPVEPAAQLVLPYFPDPLARGAALRNLTGAPTSKKGTVNTHGQLTYKPQPLTETPPESVTLIDFEAGKAWPDLLPFRLIIVEGKGAPVWDKTTRVLTVKLPKAEQTTINLSSYLEKDDLKLMGVWQWLRESLDDLVQQFISSPQALEYIEGAVALMVQYALEGGHWMLTPPKQLVLTHAVKQPIGNPRIRVLTAIKSSIGQTYAEIRGSIKTHGKSTVKLDMLATWQDPTDDSAARDGKDIIDGSAHAFEAPITLPGDVSNITSIAYYDSITQILSFNANNPPRHEFGDTRYRRVHYQAVGSSRFHEYFPPVPDNLPPGDPNGLTRASAKVAVDVPNSTRPAAPKVLYIVPTFGWASQTDTNLKVSQRLGGGLRVYLDHPWFSSGDGELLGVVLWSQTFGLAPNHLKPYVTQWGQDPFWSTTNTITFQPLGRFTNAVVTDDGLTLEELANVTIPVDGTDTMNPTVSVAGHKVAYDQGRGLWYCDIEIQSSGTYYPFVRLALTRYQPHSILLAKVNPSNDSNVLISTLDEHGAVQILQVSDNGETSVATVDRTNNIQEDACLSRVVLADFAQIAPDRSLLITYDPYNANQLTVVVSGTTYTGSYATAHIDPPPPELRIEVSVERRIAGITDDTLAWESDSSIQPQPLHTSIFDEILWSGLVKLPDKRTPGQYRIVVKEYELFISGESVLARTIAQRLVYTDALEL